MQWLLLVDQRVFPLVAEGLAANSEVGAEAVTGPPIAADDLAFGVGRAPEAVVVSAYVVEAAKGGVTRQLRGAGRETRCEALLTTGTAALPN